MPRSSRRWIARPSIAIAADALSVSIDAHLVAELGRGRARTFEGAGQLRGDVQRVDPLVCVELRVGRSEVRRRRLRRRRQLVDRAEPGVELLRPDLDVVALALVAEADVERHDAPVREALGACGKSAVESRTIAVLSTVRFTQRAASWIVVDDLLELLVLREARDGAGLAQRLHLLAVRRRSQCDDRDVGARLPQRARRLDAVEAREAVVHEHDLGLVLAAGRHGLLAVDDRRDDDEVAAQTE